MGEFSRAFYEFLKDLKFTLISSIIKFLFLFLTNSRTELSDSEASSYVRKNFKRGTE